MNIGVRDEFCSGLKSLARIFFSPLLARKSSGLPEYYLIFARKWLFEKNYRGGGPSPMGRTPTPMNMQILLKCVQLSFQY